MAHPKPNVGWKTQYTTTTTGHVHLATSHARGEDSNCAMAICDTTADESKTIKYLAKKEILITK